MPFDVALGKTYMDCVCAWPGDRQRLSARRALLLGLMLIALQTVDGVLTSIGVSRYGVELEGNPLLRFLMQEIGHIPALALMKILAGTIVIGLVLCSRRLWWINGALGALNFIYFFAAIVPWTYVLFSIS